MVALLQQMKQANIQIRIKPGYLSHQDFYRMPLVELQYQRIVDFGLDSMHNGNLPNHRQQRESTVNIMSSTSDTFTAVAQEEHWAQEHDCVVNETVQIEQPGNTIHQLFFYHQ